MLSLKMQKKIIAENIIKGRKSKKDFFMQVKKLLIKMTLILKISDFTRKQFRIVLRNCGFIDPENVDEYIARDGYKAIEKCIFENET